MPDAPEATAVAAPMRGAPTDPIAAVTHPDPYTHYAALRAEAGLHWFADRNRWALVSAPGVTTALNMPAAKVRPPSEPIPPFLQGSPADQLFGRLARMSDGAAHDAQRGRTMLLMRKLTGEFVEGGAAQVIEAVAGSWRPLNRDRFTPCR